MWRLLAPPPPNTYLWWSDFQIFFVLERYWKNLWDGMSNFLIFLILKAVGPKRGFQCFLRLCRKNCPIFTFDMSLERYWTVDFRIFENFEKSWKLSILEKKNIFKNIFFSFFGSKMVIFDFFSKWIKQA